MQDEPETRHTHVGFYGLLRRQGQVLLIQKGRGPYTGLWDLPGGSPEFGEQPHETLGREFIEETGLAVEPTGLLDVTTYRCQYRNPAGQMEDFRGSLPPSSGQRAPPPG